MMLSCRQPGPGPVNGGKNLSSTQFKELEAFVHIKQTESYNKAEALDASKHYKYGDSNGSFKKLGSKSEGQYLHVGNGIRPELPLNLKQIAHLLQRCSENNRLLEVRSIHRHVEKIGLGMNRFLGNLLVQAYGKCGALSDAHKVFKSMPQRNIFSWNIMLAAYAHNGQLDKARQIFELIPHPDVVSWNAMLAAYAQQGKLKHARQVFEKMPLRNMVSWNAMLSAYAHKGQMQDAACLFEQIPLRNVVSWTAMITGYSKHGQIGKALQLFSQMPERNVVTWTTMVTGYAQMGQIKEALYLFKQMPGKNVVSWNAIIAAYTQQGLLEEAYQFFQHMPKHDVVSWNVMISACSQNKQFNKAIFLFKRMLSEPMTPDKITFVSILDACGTQAALVQGKWVHAWVMFCNLESEVAVQNALIDMYAKCGSLNEAYELFNKMLTRDIISWTAIIVAHAQHGHGNKALCIFQEMGVKGVVSDAISFLGILSACNHAGMIDEGHHNLVRMSLDCAITVILDHYNCIVDLLGRSGWLDEAEALLVNMPLLPDSTSWRALLGSCKLHHNVEYATRAAEQAFSLDPRHAATYILLKHIYQNVNNG